MDDRSSIEKDHSSAIGPKVGWPWREVKFVCSLGFMFHSDRMRRLCFLALWFTLAVALGLAPPAQAQPALSPEEKPRGMWFWSKPSSPDGAVNIVGQPAREDEALALFRRWRIRRVYGSYADLAEKSAGVMSFLVPPKSEPIMGDIIRTLLSGRLKHLAIIRYGKYGLPFAPI